MFHKIPKNPEERQKWLESMGLNGTDIPQNAKSCSLHFEESILLTEELITISKSDLVPFENASVCTVEPSRKKLKIHYTNEEPIIDSKTTKEIFDSAIPFGNTKV